jgi:hypothetical protein
VLTLEGEAFDSRPTDISWFIEKGYDERMPIGLYELYVLPTHEPFPGDYRTKDEIRRDVIENILMEQNHPDPKAEAVRIINAGDGPAFFAANNEDW